MRLIKNWIRNSIPDRIKKFVSYSDDVEYGTISFSQFGEDMILRNFFLGKAKGFYVDIGAHHPVRYSNTWYFYRLGWSGINIDPLPGSKEQFEKVRPRDLFLSEGLSDDPVEIRYHRFKNPLQNTFSPSLAKNGGGGRRAGSAFTVRHHNRFHECGCGRLRFEGFVV